MRRKQALVRAFHKKYAGAESFVFDFEDQGTKEDVARALSSCEAGLFASEKIVVFLHPFALGEVAEKSMSEFLKEQAASLPERTILLFVHIGKVKKTQSLAKILLAKMDKEESYDVLDGRALRTLITKELASFNDQVAFSSRALEMFLALTGGDTARMISEMEKLATFRETGEITEEDIALLVAFPKEKAIFDALDALGRGDRKQALFLFRRETDNGDGVYPVLSMCAWQARRLLLVRDAYDRGIRRPSDVTVATKLPPFTVQKAMATIEHFPLSRIRNGLTLLSDIDTDLKRGKADPEASLDLFVWKF
jgi:DNA polymerase III delta subunit